MMHLVFVHCRVRTIFAGNVNSWFESEKFVVVIMFSKKRRIWYLPLNCKGMFHDLLARGLTCTVGVRTCKLTSGVKERPTNTGKESRENIEHEDNGLRTKTNSQELKVKLYVEISITSIAVVV